MAEEADDAPRRLRLELGLTALNLKNPRPSMPVELSRAAEACGFAGVWAPELQGTDPFGLLGWVGSQTRSIGLGCAVAQVTGRSAVSMATAAMTLAALSEGRFRLGLGVSGPRVVQGWHGRPYERPLSYLRDYVAVIREALSGKPVRHRGREITLPASAGSEPTEPLALPAPRYCPPVDVAGLGPRAIALAGEIADGWIPTFFSPEYVADFRALLQEGAERAGRSLDAFDIAPTVNAYVSDDREQARNLMRPVLALYIGGMGSRDQNFYNRLVQRYGFEGPAAEIQDLYLSGKKEEAAAAIPNELIDMVSLAGPADVVRDRLAAFRDAGVGTLMITPMAFTRDERIEQLRLVAELAG